METNKNDNQEPCETTDSRGALTAKERARSAVQKLKHQFPKTPEGKLFFAVVSQAILDLATRSEASARRYLRGDIVHAEACDVDSDYVRRILNEAALL